MLKYVYYGYIAGITLYKIYRYVDNAYTAYEYAFSFVYNNYYEYILYYIELIKKIL